jgi:hypothetical protein
MESSYFDVTISMSTIKRVHDKRTKLPAHTPKFSDNIKMKKKRSHCVEFCCKTIY